MLAELRQKLRKEKKIVLHLEVSPICSLAYNVFPYVRYKLVILRTNLVM